MEGTDFEIIAPTQQLINSELEHDAGFVCHYGFIPKLFAMKETPDIKYDDSAKGVNSLNTNSRINLWDLQTSYDEMDCKDDLAEYIATPSSNHVVEFKINSLQANETKWLDKVILIKIHKGKIKISYSIKSDNTDGSVSGTIEQP